MSRTYVPQALRDKIHEVSRHRCGYCLTQQLVVAMRMEIDHIISESRGGLTAEDNLWLACSSCNDAKLDRIAAGDPESGQVVPLFNPRHQSWAEHFVWSEDSTIIVGTTPTGPATVVALSLNNPYRVASRRIWVASGWHPPTD